MRYLIKYKEFKPKYYRPFDSNPNKRRDICGDHFAQFYGVMIARSLNDNPSIDRMFSTKIGLIMLLLLL